MANLQIDGIGSVTIDDAFLSLPPDKQAAEVDAIAATMRSAQTAPPAANTAAPPKKDMSLTEVATSAVRNAPASAIQFGKDMIHPVLHPIDTAEAIKNIGSGILQKVGILSGDDMEKYADAVGNFFYERYGSSEGIKNAIATDPVGVLGDLSMVLTGGGTLAARAPGLAGKAGSIVQKAGNVVDPVNAVAAGVNAAGRGAAQVVGGLATHTGAAPIREAVAAGAEGGARGQAFRDSMRGATPIEDVVTDAKGALDNMRAARGAEYRSTMAQLGQNQTVLDFRKIDAAVQAAQDIKTYKGQDLSPSTKAVRDDIAAEISAWRSLNPSDFHTAEGLDALKQKIGDIREATQYGTPARKVADSIYNAVKQTIVDQAPEYAKIMKGYEDASNIIREIERTLSLNPKASVDTAVRKLQSVLRNNVNTNYGQREVLADYLVKAGAPNLITKLSGQAMNSLMPRGLGKVVAGVSAAGGSAGVLSGIGTIPGLAMLGVAAASSPRLVGEVAHGIGRISPAGKPIGRSSFQAGRAERESRRK